MRQNTMSEVRLAALVYGSVGIEKDEARDCQAVGELGIAVVVDDMFRCAVLVSDHEINDLGASRD